MLGTNPSDCIPYWDFNRFAELLIDGKETQATLITQLNTNIRAVAIIQTAEGDIVEAVRTRQMYAILTLQDMVRDYQVNGINSKFGAQLIRIVADGAWMYALQRKRYPEGTPQAEDPATKRFEETLKKLREGSRIFIIEGMQQTDGFGNVIGTYGGQEKPTAGLVSGHTLHSNVGRPTGLWGALSGPSRFGYLGDDHDNFGWGE